MIMPDGSLRDSAYYSVIAEDWPALRTRLEAELEARVAKGSTGLPSSTGAPG
jgi:hypothetical protein